MNTPIRRESDTSSLNTLMINFRICLCPAAMLLSFTHAKAVTSVDERTERPNILWLTFEDTSAYELGCYGNPHVHTPRIDSLASRGIQFMNAWSAAPQSSAARSSLITGCYATTFGMDVHPVPYDTPSDIFFPKWLRERGYYCTNNSKTHYNSTTDNSVCWDECGRKATYNSPRRGADQPFFAVFNTVTSHMGRIRTFHTEGRRDYTREGIYPQQLSLPPHVPDLPEVRSDYAGHLEAVQDVDTWVGFFLDDLKRRGLDENTIVFVFSDHGGCQPRGKGYLYETGLHVPMVVYFPERWRHLAPMAPGTKDDTLINFVDLAPSVLSLAGVKPPEHMQGKALMGVYAVGEKPAVMFGLASNQLHHFMPVRAVRDGRYKYLRSYIPYRRFALRNYYQWGMPSNKAWDKWILGGNDRREEWEQPFGLHPAEMLFDLQSDPFELHNLVEKPACREQLLCFRNSLSAHLRETKDLGFFLPTSREGTILYNKVRKENYPLDSLYALVELAGTATIHDVPFLESKLESDKPEMRYWAAVGLAHLGTTGQLHVCPPGLLSLLNDDNPYVACEAAYATTYLGEAEKGLERLIYPANEADRKIGYSLLEALSMDVAMRPSIRAYVGELKEKAGTLPRTENEDTGLMVRGILVNLGELDMEDLYGGEAYKMGLKLNKGRRPMLPLPENN